MTFGFSCSFIRLSFWEPSAPDAVVVSTGERRLNVKKKGFGIGLYHIKQLIDEMKGSVNIDTSYHDGFRLVVRLKK